MLVFVCFALTIQKRQWKWHIFSWFWFGSSAFMPLLRFVQMSRMTTEHWSLMASAESWFLVLFITLVALQRFSSLPSFCVFQMLHVHYFFPMFMNFGVKRGGIYCCRCGQTSFKSPKMEELMWLKLMFSGTYTNQFKARSSSFYFC